MQPPAFVARAGPGAPPPAGASEYHALRTAAARRQAAGRAVVDERTGYGGYAHIGEPNAAGSFKLRVAPIVPRHPAAKRPLTRVEAQTSANKDPPAESRDFFVSPDAFARVRAIGLRALTKSGDRPKESEILHDVAPYPGVVDFGLQLLGVHLKDAHGEDLTWIKVFELLHRLSDAGCAALSADMEYYDCRQLVHPRVFVVGQIAAKLHSTFLRQCPSVDSFLGFSQPGDILVLGPGEHHLTQKITKPVAFLGCPQIGANGEEQLPRLIVSSGSTMNLKAPGTDDDRSAQYPLAFAGLHVTVKASEVRDKVENATQLVAPRILFYNCKVRVEKAANRTDERPVFLAHNVHIDNCFLLTPEDLLVVAADFVAITECTVCGTVQLEQVTGGLLLHKNNIAAPIVLGGSVDPGLCSAEPDRARALFLHNYVRETVFFPWLVLTQHLSMPYVEAHPDQHDDHALSRTYAVAVPAAARSGIMSVFLADATVRTQRDLSQYKSEFNATVILDDDGGLVHTDSLPKWHMLVVPKLNAAGALRQDGERISFNRPAEENSGGGCVVGYVAPGNFKEPPLRSIPTWEIFLESNFSAFHIGIRDLVVVNGARSGNAERRGNLELLTTLVQYASTRDSQAVRTPEELVREATSKARMVHQAAVGGRPAAAY